jgi:hypothetical protein
MPGASPAQKRANAKFRKDYATNIAAIPDPSGRCEAGERSTKAFRTLGRTRGQRRARELRVARRSDRESRRLSRRSGCGLVAFDARDLLAGLFDVPRFLSSCLRSRGPDATDA